MKIGEKGLALIKEFEGCKLQSYKCPAGVWTIGIGSTRYADGTPVKANQALPNEAAAMALLKDTITLYELDVTSLVKVPITQNQFDALVSFAYNVGLSALNDSTLLRFHKAGDYAAAKLQFARWDKNDGKVMKGLTRRRAAEAALYGKP